MQLTADELAHVVNVWPVARLGTVQPSGAPQLVPIVCVADAGMVYMPVDGKPKRGDALQRLRNVAHCSAVCLLLDHYDENWQALWWLRIDGVAEVVSYAPANAEHFARIEVLLRAKYRQYSDVAVFRTPPTMLRVTPTQHTAWSVRPVDWPSLRSPSAAYVQRT